MQAPRVCILHFAFCITCLSVSAACGAKRIPLPTDPGSPLPNFSQIHADVTKSCRGARTLTAELGLRGRAGTRRLSGRLISGFERPASMRLEMVAPFGPPGFILVTRGQQAVLLLPREVAVVLVASRVHALSSAALKGARGSRKSRASERARRGARQPGSLR